MRIQFDPDQKYQREAIDAVVDLFEGQPSEGGLSEAVLTDAAGLEFSELGFANKLNLDSDLLLENLRAVQQRMTIRPSSEPRRVYTVEMETGTGKTYVYLRTIFELHARYGWSKFIIVVPSVAIREGVLSSIELMRDHFRDLYEGVPFNSWIYDSTQASRLRSFATSNTLQILILNIQAFDKRDINVIHQETDKLSGYRPLEFIKQSRPVVILDEPQNMMSDKRKDAILSLNPLIELRYSATHRELVNLVYRLNPVEAYDAGLVKRIDVSSIIDEPDYNQPYVCLKSVSVRPIVATLEIDVETVSGPVRKSVKVRRGGEELFELSKEREQYRDYIVDEIDAAHQTVTISGHRIAVGESIGTDPSAILRAQIAETIKQHFEKEQDFARLPAGERMKVLSLFFIDKVANYAPADGKIRRWFEEEYIRIAAQYPNLAPPPVEEVHGGYFSQDKNGPKDTSGTTKADDDAYELIMKDKERLLSMEEPLRFIFSHSALREGWDNPNVFQICTLNETRSEIKKRQEIGRGLRLPVRVDGTRSFDPDRNRLTIVANERYKDFAKALQAELKEDCGVDFGGRISNNRERRKIRLKPNWDGSPFPELWQRINQRTRYNVQFSTEDLIRKAAKELADSPPIRKPRIRVERGEIVISDKGVVGEDRATAAANVGPTPRLAVPDLLSYLQKDTELTRATLAKILAQSGRLKDAVTNPQQFLNQARAAILTVVKEFLVDGIEYVKVDGLEYDQRLFEEAQTDAFGSRLIDVHHSVYEAIEVDSEIERKFASALDRDEQIKLFVKLPRSFKVETPLGTYNPDWAIVKEEGERVYMIRETKGTTDRAELRFGENAKITCGKRHFEALGSVEFAAIKEEASI